MERSPDLFPCVYAPGPNRPAHKLSVHLHASRVAYIVDAAEQGLREAAPLFGSPATWGFPSPPEFMPPALEGIHPAVEWVLHDGALRIALPIFAASTGQRAYATVSGEHQFTVSQGEALGPAPEFHCLKPGAPWLRKSTHRRCLA